MKGKYMNRAISTVSGILLSGAVGLSALGCDNATDAAGGAGGPGTSGAGAPSVSGAGAPSTASAGASNPGAGGSQPASAGAGSSSAGASGSGSAGAPASGGTGTPIAWDIGGWVDGASNPFAVQGPWYSYDDCKDAAGMASTLPCTMRDPSMMGPDMDTGWSVTPTAVCFKGTAVKVQSMMFAAQWGAGLALDLNSSGGVAAVKSPFNATAAGISGFSVDISGTAPATGIRINLTMDGVGDSNFIAAPIPGTTTFKLSQVKQGSWVTSKTPLDPTKIMAMQFQVYTNAASTTPFDFCINAIRAVTE
jgi:hypothetical protein